MVEVIQADPKIVLANIQTVIEEYQKAATKSRGVEPYVSAYCIDMNGYQHVINNGFVEDFDHNYDCWVVVMTQYEGGKPAYDAANNYSPQELHLALWDTEAEAWKNKAVFDTDPREVLSKRLLHPERKVIREHTILADLGIRSITELKNGDIFNFLASIDDKLYRSDRRVLYTSTQMDTIVGNDIFYDSLGTAIVQEHSRMTVGMEAFAEAPDMPDRRYSLEDRIGGFGGTELLERLYQEAMVKAEKLGARTIEFARASDRDGNFRLVSGVYDVILDGRVGAISIHEVGAGHAAEATRLIQEREENPNPFDKRLGEQVGISDLNIIDHGQMLIKGVRPFSYYRYDAEGVEARETYIVKDGRFNSYLHTRLTAGTLPKEDGGGVLTGNARLEAAVKDMADGLSVNEPEARMSTLFVKPKPAGPSLDELIHSLKGRGLYICGLSFGETDSAQGKVGFQEIYYINESGNLVPMRVKSHNVYIIDDVIGYMDKIRDIGNESSVEVDTGWCGSQSGFIPHTASGPAIKVGNIHLLKERIFRPRKKPLIPVPKR